MTKWEHAIFWLLISVLIVAAIAAVFIGISDNQGIIEGMMKVNGY